MTWHRQLSLLSGANQRAQTQQSGGSDKKSGRINIRPLFLCQYFSYSVTQRTENPPLRTPELVGRTMVPVNELV